MKKTKILTVLGVLLALGITACGGNKKSSSSVQSEEKSSQSTPAPASSSSAAPAPGPASSSSESSAPDTSAPEQGSSSSSSAVAHVHVWNLPNKDELMEQFSEVDEAPTCTTAGQRTWYCECNETKVEAIKKLGHDWGEWEETTPATCTVDGERTRACKREGCNVTETEVIKAEHKYGDPVTVEASGDGKEYTKEVCSVDQTIRIKVNQSQVSYASGSSRKSATPEGYTKLNGDGQSMSVKFNYTHFAIGQLYLFGRMDGWSTSGNQSAGFYRNGTPSIEVKVNGSVVDISAQQGKTYLDYFGDHDNPTELDSPSDHLSDEGYAPVGEIVLVEGINELIYKRVQTQNMIIKDFVFVIKDSEHVHAAAATYSTSETQHWHACTVPGCPTGKADAPADHTFEDKADDTRNKEATCSEKGAKVEKCSVCGYEKVTPIDEIPHTYPNEGAYTLKTPATCEAAGEEERECEVCHAKDTRTIAKLAHDFSGGVAQSYPAVTEGENQHIAADAYNCELCGKSALRWNARNFDATLSSTDLDLTHDGDKSVRFASGAVENKDGAAAVGSHIVYKINVGEDVAKAGLSFKIKNTNGSGWGANAVAPVFGLISGDSSLGAIDNGDGTYTTATHRYGLKVNGVEYFLGEDSYGNKAGVTDWFDWPVEFPLTAGVNTIDVFAYAGYRADFYEFQVTGLPHVEPAHTHVLGEWQSDDNNHWKLCTAEGCLDPEGTKYENNPHDFGEVNVTQAATCTEAGAGTKTCATCGKVVDVVIPALGHNFAASGAAVTNSADKEVTPIECSVCHATGLEMNLRDCADPTKIASDGKVTNSSKLQWTFKGVTAGTVEFYACAKLGSGENPFNTGYGLKAGTSTGEVTISGKNLSSFGATSSQSVYFLVGTVEILAADIDENGEIVIEYSFPSSQNYRHCYQNTVRIVYVA